MYELAQTLGQPLSVVLEMTVDEFHHWYTFLRLKLEMAKGKKHGTGRSDHRNKRPG
jgi:hypothetical protein